MSGSPMQCADLLGADDYEVFARRFGLDRAANFEGDDWHLHVFHSEEEIARELQLDVAEVENSLGSRAPHLARSSQSQSMAGTR